MASFNADVVLNTSVNQASLKKALRSISQVDNLVKQLKPINLFSPGSGAGPDKIRTSLQEILKISKQINSGILGSGGLARSFAGVNGQASAFLETLKNVNIKATDGTSKAKVEQLAQAFVKAEKEAKEYEKTLNDIIRKAKGLQPQDVRDQEVRNRIALVKRLRRERAEERRAEKVAQNNAKQADRERLKAAKERKRKLKEIILLEERAAKASLKRFGAGAVGAGFPLLFGGGPGGVLGGLAGGLLGGQQFGFEASLGLSALGTQLDKVGASALNLARNLNNPSDLLEELSNQGFKVTQSLKDNVAALEEQGRVADAARIAQEKLIEKVGTGGVQAFTSFNEAATKLQDKAARLAQTIFTELEPAITAFIGFVDKLIQNLLGPEIQRRFANENPEDFEQIRTQARREIEKREDFGRSKEADRLRLEAKITELIVERNRIVKDTSKVQIDSSLQFIQNNNLAAKARERAKDIAKEELKFAKEMLDIERERADLTNRRLQDTINFIRRNTENSLGMQQTIIENQQTKRVTTRDVLGQTRNAQLNILKNGGAEAEKIQISVASIFKDLLAIKQANIDDEIDKFRAILVQANVEAKEFEPVLREVSEALKNAATQDANLRQRLFKTNQEIADENLAIINQQIKIEEAVTDEARKQAELELVLLRLRAASKNLTSDQLEALEAATTKLFNLQNEAEDKFINIANTVGTTVANAMQTALVDTITAAIQGADDLSERLQNLASTLLADLGKIFINAGLKGLAGDDKVGFFTALTGGLRADGGPVTANKSYIVGERGPELFVPGQSGNVISNENSRAMLGRYANSNQQIPTFRLETEVINGVEYATVEQVRAMGQAAARDGAAAGFGQSMKTLQNSRSQRAKLGIR